MAMHCLEVDCKGDQPVELKKCFLLHYVFKEILNKEIVINFLMSFGFFCIVYSLFKGFRAFFFANFNEYLYQCQSIPLSSFFVCFVWFLRLFNILRLDNDATAREINRLNLLEKMCSLSSRALCWIRKLHTEK